MGWSRSLFGLGMLTWLKRLEDRRQLDSQQRELGSHPTSSSKRRRWLAATRSVNQAKRRAAKDVWAVKGSMSYTPRVLGAVRVQPSTNRNV
jgi:hypothetical protein